MTLRLDFHALTWGYIGLAALAYSAKCSRRADQRPSAEACALALGVPPASWEQFCCHLLNTSGLRTRFYLENAFSC